MRGEYLSDLIGPLLDLELPPRARRIPKPWSGISTTTGTTSACAENTARGKGCSSYHWNYLRVRGEYSTRQRMFFIPLELPPRARRILGNDPPPCGVGGTTSACAENTCHMLTCHTRSWNYLRVRGEYSQSTLTSKTTSELPPRARRILAGPVKDFAGNGTTSACAENTKR